MQTAFRSESLVASLRPISTPPVSLKSPMDTSSKHSFLDPYAVEGLERAFRFAVNFKNETPFGAAGLTEQLAIWNEANSALNPTHLIRFYEKIGLNESDATLYVLDTMSKRLRLLQETFGDALPAWSLLCLVSMLSDGSIERLVAQFEATGTLDAKSLLNHFTEGALEDWRNRADK